MAVFRGPDDRDDEDQFDSRRSGSSGGNAGSGVTFWWFCLQYIRRNRGRVLGVLIGLWAGFGIMEIGVLWTLFISASVGIGYFIGKRLDENQEDLLDFLDRVLPPGRG